MKFWARKIESGIPGTLLGNPIAAFVESTSVPSPRVGHWLGGGDVSCITHSRNADRTRFTSAVAGTGLAVNVPRPQLLPGQFTALAPTGRGGFCVVAPLPPPSVELGR